MTMKRWDGSSLIDLTVAKRWDGAAWIDLTVAKRWDGAAWINIPLPGGGGGGTLTVSASPGLAHGQVTNNNLFANVTSNVVVVTPAGGTAPYSHAWTKITGDSSPTPSNPTGASTSWSATVPKWDSKEATWRDTVTDSLGATATVDVVVLLTHDGLGDPP